MRARGLMAGCALAGTAALAAVGAVRARSDPAAVKPLEPAAHRAEAGAMSTAGWLRVAGDAIQRQVAAERREAQSAAAPVADRVVALALKPSPAPGLPQTGGAVAADPPEARHPTLMTAADRHELLKLTLADAARRHGLDPGLVMAVAWWESGWDMSKVSDTGAVGIMQIDPGTARDLGPRLLGRQVDVHDLYDNADLGAAVLAADIKDAGGNLPVALASYYEGGGNVDPSNLDANAQFYVTGVAALQTQFDSGQDPTTPAS